MRLRRYATLAMTLCSSLALISSPAVAAPNTAMLQPEYAGNDISWPQCKRLSTLPHDKAFVVVGVNNGTPDTSNPCFASELTWASEASGTAGQPLVSLYVNTANPGDALPVKTNWPTNDFDVSEPGLPDINPYGHCNGSDNTACSWQYGYNMANLDVHARGVPAPKDYRWYLDVETANSWSNDTARNAADLEGMVTYFKHIGVEVDIYSTYRQWGIIVGKDYDAVLDASGDMLDGLPSWVPGAGDATSAKANCDLKPFSKGGSVQLSQYLSRSANLDYDVPC